MPSTFLPRQEAKLDRWLANFSEQISAAPASFGLSPSDANLIEQAVKNWHDAFLVAFSPGTRTMTAVTAKNEQKKIVVLLVRRYAGMIRAHPNVDSAQDIALGLHPRRPQGAHPSQIPAPETYPGLQIAELDVGSHTVRITRGQGSGKARPPGAIGALLFRAIADEPVSDREEARFLAFVTRAEYASEFARGPANRGKFATYFARWTNSKGELGPWSPPATMLIAA